MQNVTTSSVRLTQCLFIPKKASSKAFARSPQKEPNKNQGKYFVLSKISLSLQAKCDIIFIYLRFMETFFNVSSIYITHQVIPNWNYFKAKALEFYYTAIVNPKFIHI